MLPPFPRGVPITRAGLNDLPTYTLNMIRRGAGIRFAPGGDGSIIISTDSADAKPSATGGDGSSFALGKVISLDADGDLINVYLYDFQTETWKEAQTQIYKPYALRYSIWNGKTITYTDGTSVTYDATALEKKYQRRATWSGTKTEVQEITSPYWVGENLYIFTARNGEYHDLNQAGRHWAVNMEEA